MSEMYVVAYKTPAEASLAVDHLMEHGVPRDDIGLLMSDETHGAHFDIEENTKATEGAGVGGTVGTAIGAIGATAAAVAGLAIPGVGFLAAGPIMTALAGAGAGAASGGLVGGLAGLGMKEHEVKAYERILKEDGVLVGVRAKDDSREKLVKDLKNKTEPVRISSN
jgi:uncharacterized membrane protein